MIRFEAPAKCPRCGAPAIKETRVREKLEPGAPFVETKGSVKFECGAKQRWKYFSTHLEPMLQMEPECLKYLERRGLFPNAQERAEMSRA